MGFQPLSSKTVEIKRVSAKASRVILNSSVPSKTFLALISLQIGLDASRLQHPNWGTLISTCITTARNEVILVTKCGVSTDCTDEHKSVGWDVQSPRMRGIPYSMLTRRNNKAAQHFSGTRAGAVVEVLQKGATLAPKVYQAVKEGIKFAGGIGKSRSQAKKGKNTNVSQSRLVDGSSASRQGPAALQPVVAPNPGTRSMQRQDAPTTLALKFDGPEYQFYRAYYQGMEGLGICGKFVVASIEQNSTTAQRGLLRSLQLATSAGDFSFISSPFSPYMAYVAGTNRGRLDMTTTPIFTIGSSFRKYRVRKLVFKYEAEVASTVTGGLALAFSMDEVDTYLGSGPSALGLSQMACSLLTSAWDDAILDCTKSVDSTLKESNPNGNPLSTLPIILANCGTLACAGDQAFTANSVIGKLICYMEVEFYGVGPVPASWAETIHQRSTASAQAERDRIEMYAEADRRNAQLQQEREEKEKEVEKPSIGTPFTFVEQSPSTVGVQAPPKRSLTGYLLAATGK